MIASVLIGAVSLLFLVYWFRYSCLMLLEANPASRQAGAVARANRLEFLEVQQTLASESEKTKFEDLYRSLDRDYRILAYLLEHSTGLDMPALERRMLLLDYRVMRVAYRLVRGNSPDFARSALLEMANVLGCFSQKMGERTAYQALSA